MRQRYLLLVGEEHHPVAWRFNTGGNVMLTRDFLTSWPSRVSLPGRLFVLESPITFSAGIVDVAYLKQAGGERVTLVGGADATYRFQTPTAER